MEPELGRNVKLQITRASGLARNSSGHRLGGFDADGQTVTLKAKRIHFGKTGYEQDSQKLGLNKSGALVLREARLDRIFP